MELYELKEEQEKVILVGVQTRENDDTEDSLEELKELVKTAGAEVLGTVIQARETIHPGYYVGTGKLEEIRMIIDGYGATGIVCDDELSPSQINNLERELQCKIMDRTMVILDIFAGVGPSTTIFTSEYLSELSSTRISKNFLEQSAA